MFRSLPLLGQEVLIGGVRRPMLGVVTMDQLMVDCGPDADVEAGDPVVLLGAQGDETHHRPTSGRPGSARSRTRSCAPSAPAWRGRYR